MKYLSKLTETWCMVWIEHPEFIFKVRKNKYRHMLTLESKTYFGSSLTGLLSTHFTRRLFHQSIFAVQQFVAKILRIIHKRFKGSLKYGLLIGWFFKNCQIFSHDFPRLVFTLKYFLYPILVKKVNFGHEAGWYGC